MPPHTPQQRRKGFVCATRVRCTPSTGPIVIAPSHPDQLKKTLCLSRHWERNWKHPQLFPDAQNLKLKGDLHRVVVQVATFVQLFRSRDTAVSTTTYDHRSAGARNSGRVPTHCTRATAPARVATYEPTKRRARLPTSARARPLSTVVHRPCSTTCFPCTQTSVTRYPAPAQTKWPRSSASLTAGVKRASSVRKRMRSAGRPTSRAPTGRPRASPPPRVARRKAVAELKASGSATTARARSGANRI